MTIANLARSFFGQRDGWRSSTESASVGLAGSAGAIAGDSTGRGRAGAGSAIRTGRSAAVVLGGAIIRTCV